MRSDADMFEFDASSGVAEFDDFNSFEEGVDGLDAMDGFGEDADAFDPRAALRQAWDWLKKDKSVQRKVALGAAKGAIQSAGQIGGDALGTFVGQHFKMPTLGKALGGVAGGALGGLAALVPQEMDYFADLAAETEDEGEAEAFLGALVPLAAQLYPKAASSILRVAPQLMRGLAGTAQKLHGNPTARQFLRTSGQVMQRTAADIARQSARGKPITGQQAAQRLAKNTYSVMRDRQQVRQALLRAQQMRQLGKN